MVRGQEMSPPGCLLRVVCLTVSVFVLCLNASLAQILNTVEFKFREEEKEGSFVGNVGSASRLATSLTEYEFARLKFNLADSKYFRINERTGSLTSAVKIDREGVCESQLVCKLTNDVIVYTSVGAGNYDILNVITVIVELLDINDNAPEFPSGTVALTIPENNEADQVLRTRSALDRDSGDNSVKQYRFRDMTETFRLSVHRNPDGSSYLGLLVKERLDREIRDFYQVIVIATDGGYPQRTGSVIINITVTDMNDNFPEFSLASYNETMPENMALRVPIMRVVASDRDAGKNGDISYQFSTRVPSKVRQKFYIDEHTGEIFAQSNVDYEEEKLFQFIVEAVDHGSPQQTSRTNVILHVMDVNDNAPRIVINLPPTGTEVAENESLGKFIAHVSVLDLDSGRNGAATCSMNDENFSLSSFSDNASNRFKVELARPLDYEQSTFHRVTITCSDGGTPSLSNSITFVVSVLDVNDNSPSFTESKYQAEVLENQEGDEQILEVTAHDWDSGDLGRVSYYLEDKYDGLFSIDPVTGVVKVVHTLDREVTAKYEFHVIARDHGPERLSSSALVVVNVEDENDEPPRFLNPAYFGDVLENQPAGTSVALSSALDNDSPVNSKMEYSILKLGPDYLHFSIHPTSGVITNKVMFDRENRQVYHFVVQVMDPTKPSFFDTCNFTVRILDVNDHAPVIQPSPDDNATLFIEYSSPVGSVITNIFAYDGDEVSSQRSDLTFFIERGDPDQLFDLDRYTGRLTLGRMITSRDLKTHNLVIAVQDGGHPPRFDTKQLSIIVNGTIYSSSEAGIGQNILIAIIVICITVVMGLVVLVIVLLLRKSDRQKRRNRAEGTISEEKMYQLDPALAENSHNLKRKGHRENILPDSSTAMLERPGIMASENKHGDLRRPPLDEESRLIEILKKNDADDEDVASVASEDTDPSDSGRGGSEDETNHRGSGVEPEHLGNKPYPNNCQRGAPSYDPKHRNQPLHHQKFHPPRPVSQTSAPPSSLSRRSRQPGSTTRSPHGSVTSDVDSDISGSRASQSRSDMSRSQTPANNILSSGNSDTSGRSSKQRLPFRSCDQQTSRRLVEESPGASNIAPVQTFQGQSAKLSHTSQPQTSNFSNRQTQPNFNNRPTQPSFNKSYASQPRTYRYTDRGYPISADSLSSPTSLPEDDDKTTTSGSYAINHEDLRHDLDAIVLHDTVV